MKICFAIFLSLLAATAMAQSGVAVVELFTSQGCSSCPAADRMLSTVITNSRKAGQKVYALSFHVDYWNNLGWKDPYSSKQLTARQYKYAELLSAQVYTPQIVVNGTSEFVGSDQERLRTALAAELSKKPRYEISITNVDLKDGKLSFSYSIDHSPSGETLNIAIVEKSVENFVPRGENSGKTLRTDNVVRLLTSRDAKSSDKVQLDADNIKPGNLSVILFMHDRDFKICAASAKDL